MSKHTYTCTHMENDNLLQILRGPGDPCSEAVTKRAMQNKPSKLPPFASKDPDTNKPAMIPCTSMMIPFANSDPARHISQQ